MSLEFQKQITRAFGKPARLRRLRAVAIKRVQDAAIIGWAPLEESWRADLERIETALAKAEWERTLPIS